MQSAGNAHAAFQHLPLPPAAHNICTTLTDALAWAEANPRRAQAPQLRSRMCLERLLSSALEPFFSAGYTTYDRWLMTGLSTSGCCGRASGQRIRRRVRTACHVGFCGIQFRGNVHIRIIARQWASASCYDAFARAGSACEM